jgi:hypothetical protein
MFADHAIRVFPRRSSTTNDQEITEFFGDKNREPITLDQVPATSSALH